MAEKFNEFVNSHSPIIVCLDEFDVSGDWVRSDGVHPSFSMILLRNLLRYCNVVPVLLGTNSRISDLIGKSSVNYGASRGLPGVWCTIVLKLPRIAAQTFF